jgi:hypothetical protein
MPTTTISRLDAVRQALAQGKEKTAAGVAYIRSTFGLDISAATFQNYRATIRAVAPKKRGRPVVQAPAPPGAAVPAAAPKKRGRRRGRKRGGRPPAAAVLPSAVVGPIQRGRLDIDDVARVLELCERYGAETVQALVVLLAK